MFSLAGMLVTTPLFALFGPPGSGKTTTARAVCERIGGVHLEYDELLPQDILTKLRAGVPADDDDRRRAMAVAICATRQARSAAQSPVVVSCAMRTASMRRQFLAAFPEARLVLLVASAEARVARMLEREVARTHLLDTETRERLERLPERAFGSVAEPHEVIDASGPQDGVVETVVDFIRAHMTAASAT